MKTFNFHCLLIGRPCENLKVCNEPSLLAQMRKDYLEAVQPDKARPWNKVPKNESPDAKDAQIVFLILKKISFWLR